jgi:hypothetical protein
MCRSSNNGWIARSRFRSIFLRCVSRIQYILKMHWLNVREGANSIENREEAVKTYKAWFSGRASEKIICKRTKGFKK